MSYHSGRKKTAVLRVLKDGGKTWSATNEGPTSCCVDQLFWMSDTLVAVTYGRGIFAIDLSNPSAAH